MTAPGWSAMAKPPQGAEAFEVSPFARLARSHAVAVAGDTLVTIALAGTLFFAIDPSEARSKVFLYLALTMAPFAVVAPLVGPALDRAPGGRRWMIIGSGAARALVCALMIRDVDSLFLFPEAFVLLVLTKSYHVAKSAMVPSTVHSDEELVEANSKLSLISGLVGFVAAAPGAVLLQLGGSEWVLGLATIVFAAAAAVGVGITKTTVAAAEATDEEREELRGLGIVLAGSAMGLLRAIVGFLTFLLAFDLRTEDSPTWHFALVLGVSAAASLAGAGLAPILRRRAREERIITALLVGVAVAGVIGAWTGGLAGAALVALAVGLAAASAKQAFDAIIQRDAPDANRGRSFARFETRFQLSWVVGAVAGIIPMPAWVGFLCVAGAATFAAVSYVAGSRGVEQVSFRRVVRLRRRSGSFGDDATTPVDVGFMPTSPAVPASIATPDHHPTVIYDRPDSFDPVPEPDPGSDPSPAADAVDPARGGEPTPPVDPTRVDAPSHPVDPTLRVDDAPRWRDDR